MKKKRLLEISVSGDNFIEAMKNLKIDLSNVNFTLQVEIDESEEIDEFLLKDDKVINDWEFKY